MSPLVSVCIPTYNGAAYLVECLESVQKQTFSDLEILIVDDRSSDDTVGIATAFARHDSRIKVSVNDANLGLAQNWNHSAELAGGEWIKFVFQDDLIRPDCIARMVAAARGTQAPIISCDRELIFDDQISEEIRVAHLKHRTRIQAAFSDSSHWSAREFCEEALRSLVIWNILGEPTAVMLHRDVFREFGWFNPHLRMLADLEFWARVASNAGVVYVPEMLATFRVHEMSTSGHFRATEARRYRRDMVEPLMIIHEYAFHPVFAKLRAVAASRRPRLDLEKEFWRRALLVQWFAKTAGQGGVGRNESLLDEWHMAVGAYPRLAQVPLKERVMAKMRALKKTLTPRTEGGRRADPSHGRET